MSVGFNGGLLGVVSCCVLAERRNWRSSFIDYGCFGETFTSDFNTCLCARARLYVEIRESELKTTAERSATYETKKGFDRISVVIVENIKCHRQSSSLADFSRSSILLCCVIRRAQVQRLKMPQTFILCTRSMALSTLMSENDFSMLSARPSQK